MSRSSFFIRTLLLGLICKFSTTRYLLVEIDGSSGSGKNDTVHARQIEEDLVCPITSSGPCGWMRPVPGTNVIMSMGRPQRCQYTGTPPSFQDCKGLCERWNRNPPPNHVGPPCAGFDFAENASGTGTCELLRSVNYVNNDLLCPQFSDDFQLSGRNNWKAVTSASQICRFTSDSLNNPNLPQFRCFAVFGPLVDTCPPITNCPA